MRAASTGPLLLLASISIIKSGCCFVGNGDHWIMLCRSKVSSEAGNCYMTWPILGPCTRWQFLQHISIARYAERCTN